MIQAESSRSVSPTISILPPTDALEDCNKDMLYFGRLSLF